MTSKIPDGKLANRIAAPYQSKDPDHAKTFDALRHVGNVGGHEGRIKERRLLTRLRFFKTPYTNSIAATNRELKS